jgi:DMSO/TMAO reductase YedYZ molybdopterin-dependent catalytic subunit
MRRRARQPKRDLTLPPKPGPPEVPFGEVYGAPLRLRVENQLGFKMVKRSTAIEFVKSFKHVRQGERGFASDHEFFDTVADI